VLRQSADTAKAAASRRTPKRVSKQAFGWSVNTPKYWEQKLQEYEELSGDTAKYASEWQYLASM
jgi:hypothetical protein